MEHRFSNRKSGLSGQILIAIATKMVNGRHVIPSKRGEKLRQYQVVSSLDQSKVTAIL